jgi:radical SAM-linked protein
MWYTQGFNPHAKVIFGLPLSVGTESECEMIDLRLDRDISPAELRDRLNAELTEEMRVEEVYEPTTKFADIGWAKYEMELNLENADAKLPSDIEQFFTTSPVLITKKTKAGDKEIDIVPMIKKIKAVFDPSNPNRIRISTVLRAGTTEHLNPEFLISAAKEKCGILSGDPTEESYSILRTHVYLEDGSTEFR